MMVMVMVMMCVYQFPNLNTCPLDIRLGPIIVLVNLREIVRMMKIAWPVIQLMYDQYNNDMTLLMCHHCADDVDNDNEYSDDRFKPPRVIVAVRYKVDCGQTRLRLRTTLETTSCKVMLMLIMLMLMLMML